MMRSLIAMAAAFAFALQMLLTGVLTTQAAVAAPDGAFVICLGSGDQDSGHGSDTAPAKHVPCVLCLLAKAAHALPSVPEAVSTLDLRQLAVLGPAPAVLVEAFEAPASQYQRGPPQTVIAS